MRRFRPALPLLAVALAASLAFAAGTVEELGLDPTQVEDSLIGALRGWYGAPDVPAAVRSLSDEDKVAAVQTLGVFAKSFFASAEFGKRYEEVRKSSKPKRSFGLPKVNLDPKALAMKAVDKASGKPAPVTELDKDPKAQLKKRLAAFLEVTADVDYDAETTAGNRKGQFVDKDYEAKPNEWKMCYRAGRATGEAIRGVAKEWLAELP